MLNSRKVSRNVYTPGVRSSFKHIAVSFPSKQDREEAISVVKDGFRAILAPEGAQLTHVRPFAEKELLLFFIDPTGASTDLRSEVYAVLQSADIRVSGINALSLHSCD